MNAVTGGFRSWPRVAAALAGLLLGGCSWLPAPPTTLNPFASSASPKVPPLEDFTPSATLKVDWHGEVGASEGLGFQPAVVGSSVFAAGRDGTVVRFDDGRPAWKVRAEGKLSAGVGANARLAAVATDKGAVIAVDAANGQVKWTAPINAEVLAPPAVTDAIVVVRTSDHRLLGLDSATGKQKWIYQRANPPLALRSFAGVVVDGNVVVAGYPGGKVVAVNLNNGVALMEVTVASPKGATELERVADVTGLPVLGRQEICAVAYQGRVGCFEAGSGNTLWSRELSSTVGMDRDSRQVYLTDDKDGVHALDGSTGASAWKQAKFSQRGVTRPMVLGGFVVVADREGYVHLLQKEDGSLAARLRLERSAVVAAPRALGPGMVVQTQAGGIYALSVQ